MDRDAICSEAFRMTLKQRRVQAERLRPGSSNLWPRIERYMRSVKKQCLERMTFYWMYLAGDVRTVGLPGSRSFPQATAA